MISSIKAMHHTTLTLWYRAWYSILDLGQRRLRPIIILGALLLSIVVGLVVVRQMFKDEMLLAALIAPSAILILFKLGRYEYGIILILISAGVIRFAIPATEWSVIVTSLMVTMGLVGLWILQMLLQDQKIFLKPSPINRSLLAFVVISIIAYVWGNIFRDPLVTTWNSFPIVQIAALMVNILLPVLVLLISNKIEEIKWLKWSTGIMLALGTGAIIGRLFGIEQLIHSPYKTVILAIHDSGLFRTWVGALAYALFLFNYKLSWRKRIFLLVLTGAWIYYSFILTSSWVSGWMPLLVACAAVTYMRSKPLFLLVSAVVIIYIALNFDYYWETIVLAEEEEGSGTGRIELWETNLNHIRRHPFFGMGPAGYAVYNMSYHPEDARSTHNNYFDIAAQTGLIGLAALLWMFVTFIRTEAELRRNLRGQRNFEEAFATAMQAGTIGVMVGMMLGDWILPFAYNQGIAGFDNASYTWFFLGCSISLYHIVQARKNISPGTG